MLICDIYSRILAEVAESVYATDLKSVEVIHEGSSPSFSIYRDVVQLARMLVLGTRGRWFESSHPEYLRQTQILPI